jgi:choline dehydrogenase-like flavoprotein
VNFFEDPLTRTYDAIVVGSGATGGWAAKQLAEAGLEVALLEAGRDVSPREFTEHKSVFQLKYRDMYGAGEWRKRRPVQVQCYACTEYNYDWFVDDVDNHIAHLRESRSAGSACGSSAGEPCAGGARAIG